MFLNLEPRVHILVILFLSYNDYLSPGKVNILRTRTYETFEELQSFIDFLFAKINIPAKLCICVTYYLHENLSTFAISNFADMETAWYIFGF